MLNRVGPFNEWCGASGAPKGGTLRGLGLGCVVCDDDWCAVRRAEPPGFPGAPADYLYTVRGPDQALLPAAS